MATKPSHQKAPESLERLRELANKVLGHLAGSKDTLEESLTRVLTATSEKTYQNFDRAWIYEVVSGVLRYKGRLDYIIDTYSLKKKPSGEIRRYLQIAIFQLLAEEVPSALVVSETVNCIRKNDGEAPSKFSNAVLRKVADSKAQWRSWTVTESSPFEEQLAWCSLPEWLFKRLRKERGSPFVFEFSKSVLERPSLWYRTKEESMILDEGYTGREPKGFVQDISNQKLVDEAVDFIKERFPSKAPKILDLCSAPGGKSLGLAYAGYHVTATDLDESRLMRVTENRNRLGLEGLINVKAHSDVWDSPEQYDLIWIDAPCSSIGIIRRHPEIKWNRNYTDVERIVERQIELQKWAEAHLAPGGVILYSTCSLLQLENKLHLETLAPVKTMEWVPHQAPFGDGIHAIFAEILKK